jgi:hypothetical protein
VIWALLAWYFFTSAAAGVGAILTSDDLTALEDQVSEIVAAPERRQTVLGTLKGLKKELKTFERAYAKSGRNLDKLYKDHVDHSDEAQAILDDLNAQWEQGQQSYLDAHFALRRTLTEEEWEQLFAVDR